MRLYLLLDRLFPRSFPAKVFLVAFVGTHIPLIAAVVWILSRDTGLGLLHPIMGVLLIATLLGTAITLLAVWALLTPIRRLRAAMEDFDATGRLAPDLVEGADDIGQLTGASIRMARRLSRHIRIKTQEAETDALTGLLNRRGLAVHAEKIIGGAVISIDLNGFKSVNDELGHAAGDQVLEQVARNLAKVTRDCDVLARPGGDEFVVVAPDLTPSDADAMAHRLRATIDEGFLWAKVPIAASVGVAMIEDGWDDAMKEADNAMYAAKRRSREASAGVTAEPVEETDRLTG